MRWQSTSTGARSRPPPGSFAREGAWRAGSSTVNTAALAERTAKIPIVFINVSDPIQSGFTDGLSKPSRNITGFVVFDPTIGGKMLQLLRDLKPAILRVTTISNAEASAGRLIAKVFRERTAQYGREMGVEYKVAEVRTA